MYICLSNYVRNFAFAPNFKQGAKAKLRTYFDRQTAFENTVQNNYGELRRETKIEESLYYLLLSTTIGMFKKRFRLRELGH